MQRASRIVSHVSPASGSEVTGRATAAGVAASPSRSPDDVVIVSAVRTAVGRAKKGVFKDTHPTELLAAVLRGVVDKAGLNPSNVADIVVGNVLAPGGFATQARMAMFLAGYPETVSINTVNRQCSSGLQAVANVAGAIAAGYYEIGIGAGVESMSQHDMMGAVGELNDRVLENPLAAACLVSMGQTSENVAERFKISRKVQDEMAVSSHAKAIAAAKAGKFASEIVAVTTKYLEGTEEKKITVTADDGPRPTTFEGVSKLKAAFKKDGSTTAGNSSQVSDGAAAVLLMTRRKANELKLPVLARFRSYAVSGVAPDVMGIGPAVAIPEALKKAGLAIADIDVFEINEAFASQASYCVAKLSIPPAKLNPNGGAIALGHPLGCTGARQIATLLPELKRSGGKLGVVSMCIGTGMGAAAVFEAE